MSERTFTSKIAYSSKELTHKQQMMLKDTSDAINLNNALSDKVDGGDEHPAIFINVDSYALVDIHNEKAEGDKDYTVIVVLDKDGTKYTTGSESFKRSFQDIMDDMSDETEDWALKVYLRPSKNYKGRDFITCAVI